MDDCDACPSKKVISSPSLYFRRLRERLGIWTPTVPLPTPCYLHLLTFMLRRLRRVLS